MENRTLKLDVSAEVSAALAENRPVVALESTIISHGMPYPQNVETAHRVQDAVREQGATPATIAVIGGRLTVGLDDDDVERLGKKGQEVIKTSRRDLPFVVARKLDGATTVAATMIVAEMAGIAVFATGGIGGVHRGVEDTLDISADLEELGRTSVAVVCAGAKSILDIGRTLEYLETRGVPVVGYRTDSLPAFYTRDSGFGVDYRVDSPSEAAAALHAKWDMGLSGGAVIANPIPEEHALDRTEMDARIEAAIAEMNDRGITGKDTTPFLLASIAEATEGRSLEANIHLVLNNAAVAAEIATAYIKLSQEAR
ncbi:MAG: pseudouridine-5'-phosphate glycosidase [Woeseiaceae bacterium]|nr:pseudouridine-5'-phosphate glycosidase [Woeseiaceae bacterium]